MGRREITLSALWLRAQRLLVILPWQTRLAEDEYLHPFLPSCAQWDRRSSLCAYHDKRITQGQTFTLSTPPFLRSGVDVSEWQVEELKEQHLRLMSEVSTLKSKLRKQGGQEAFAQALEKEKAVALRCGVEGLICAYLHSLHARDMQEMQEMLTMRTSAGLGEACGCACERQDLFSSLLVHYAQEKSLSAKAFS